MKSVFVLVVLFVGLANCYPASDLAILGVQNPSDTDADPFGEGPIVDTGYFSSYPSLDDFYKRLQDVIASVRKTIQDRTENISTSFGDLGPGNTTSYTKIIGNHKVEVNETEYKKDTDFGTSHVKVSFINVKPLHPDTIETGDSTEADTEVEYKPIPKDREPLAETIENEIVPDLDEDIETFDMTKNERPEMSDEFPVSQYIKLPLSDIDTNEINRDFEDFRNEIEDTIPGADLSNDIKVNDIMVADGAPRNPDAEYIL